MDPTLLISVPEITTFYQEAFLLFFLLLISIFSFTTISFEELLDLLFEKLESKRNKSNPFLKLKTADDYILETEEILNMPIVRYVPRQDREGIYKLIEIIKQDKSLFFQSEIFFYKNIDELKEVLNYAKSIFDTLGFEDQDKVRKFLQDLFQNINNEAVKFVTEINENRMKQLENKIIIIKQ